MVKINKRSAIQKNKLRRLHQAGLELIGTVLKRWAHLAQFIGVGAGFQGNNCA